MAVLFPFSDVTRYSIVANQFLNWFAATVRRTVALSYSSHSPISKKSSPNGLDFFGASDVTRNTMELPSSS